MIRYLQESSTITMALAIIGATIAAGWLLVLLVDRCSGPKLKEAYRSLPLPFGGALMAGQIIFCALLSTSVWHDMGVAQQAVLQEARALNFAAALIDEEANPAWRPAIAAYAAAVSQQEWQTMSDGAENPEARRILDDLHRMAVKGWPGLDAGLRSGLQDALKDVEVARQNRLMIAVDHIPSEVWFSVVLSALVVLTFSAFALAHVSTAARITATLFGLVIGAMWFSVLAVDRPFLGKVAVSSAPIAKLAVKR